MDGSHLRRIVPYRAVVGISRHDWSPDGRRILFCLCSSAHGHAANLATIRPDGSDLTQLTFVKAPLAAMNPTYSPDGRWIIFRIFNERTDQAAIWRTRPDGSDQTRIKRVPFFPVGMDWGPQPKY